MKPIRNYINIAMIAIMIIIPSCTMTSCQTKQHAINQLENFSEELRDHSSQYSIKQWQDAGEQFIKIRKNISKYELDYTPEEKARIGKLEGKCAGYMARGMKEGFFDKIKGFGNEIKNAIMGILNAISE